MSQASTGEIQGSEVKFGPAMLALSPMKQKFVLALLDQKTPNFRRAALSAGYSDVGEGAKVRGSNLSREGAVIAALHEEAKKRFRLLGWIGVTGLARIAADEKHPDNYKANKDLADRFGFMAAQEHHVVHEEKRVTAAQKMAEIKELCEFLNIPFDPARFLGANPLPDAKLIEGKVIDG